MKNILNAMGPGLLMAGAAIGVSHLVQSTRAGAAFGFALVGVILLTNLLKYPFFEFGHRYTLATGNSLLDGYNKLGKKYVPAFLILSTFTALGTMSGVTYVTGALAYNLMGETLSVSLWSAIIMAICAALLVFGHYALLDKLIKLIMLFLFSATIAALVIAVGKSEPTTVVLPTSPYAWIHLPFLIALMGWMPAPIETSVWQSLWCQAKTRTDGRCMTAYESHFDFNFGYITTALMAVGFLSLGALVMYGQGIAFSDSGGQFAAQIIELYTQQLGEWSKPFIAFAAFSAMFSTTLTCLDAYPRSLTKATQIIQGKDFESRKIYYAWLAWSAVGGILVIGFFATSIKALVDFVTIAAFLTAPIFALFNYILIFKNDSVGTHRPGQFMKVWCYLGLIYLFGFSLLFIAYRFNLIPGI